MSGNLSAMFKLARRRPAQRIVCAAAVGLTALTALTPPASAGFLDFLFKLPSPSAVEPQSPSVQPYAVQAPVTALRIVRPAAHRKAPVLRVNVSIVQAEVGKTKSDPCCKSGEDPVAYLLHDATLRPGDAVMTRDGIRIFQGPVSSHHVWADFAPLATATHVDSSARATLAQVDVREGETLPTQVAAQKQSKPKVVAQLPKSARRFALAGQ